MKETLYIAGKISAPTPEEVQENLDFMLDSAAEFVTENPEYTPFIPGEANQRLGKKLAWSWKDYMRADLPFVKQADAVLMTQGWEESRGARLEEYLSRRWGKVIFYHVKGNI